MVKFSFKKDFVKESWTKEVWSIFFFYIQAWKRNLVHPPKKIKTL